MIKAESDYYPWGGELQFVNNDSNDYKFTGKKRDIETGLDYFGARYYSNGLGRFLTPDWAASPEPVPYADFSDPQSLNQYTYVRNIPTVRVDPDGHWPTLLAPIAKEIAKDVVIVIGAEEVIVVVTVLKAADFVDQMIHPQSVGQSDADERAQIQQASQERAAQNGGVDPQEPQVSTSGAGAGQKGGKPYDDTPENRDRIAQKKPPIGKDGHPVELHSPEQTHKDQLQELTKTDHRLNGNFKKNHRNTGQQRSVVPKNQRAKDRRAHWKKVHEDKTKK